MCELCPVQKRQHQREHQYEFNQVEFLIYIYWEVFLWPRKKKFASYTQTDARTHIKSYDCRRTKEARLQFDTRLIFAVRLPSVDKSNGIYVDRHRVTYTCEHKHFPLDAIFTDESRDLCVGHKIMLDFVLCGNRLHTCTYYECRMTHPHTDICMHPIDPTYRRTQKRKRCILCV